jgi:sulfotransferase family protein
VTTTTSDDAGGTRPIVYLHIGSPKSGTTFLQQVIWKNTEKLAQQGVLVPGRDFDDHERIAWDVREVPREPTDPVPPWEGHWNTMVDRIFERGLPRAIVSHETLAACEPEQIARTVKALGDAEVHVIYTCRDLESLIPSEWQEYVKHRCYQDYATWLADVIDTGITGESGNWFWTVHDVVAVLKRWAEHVPPERIHLVTVPQPGAPRDLLWRRFAELIGIDPDSCDLDVPRANSSLGVVEAELLRRVNNAIGPQAPMWLYTQTATVMLGHNILPNLRNGRKVPFPEARRPWVRERAAGFVSGIKAGGYDVVGDLAELLPPAEGRPADHRPVTEADLNKAAVETILGLMDAMMEQRAETRRLREQIVAERRGPLPKLVVRHMSERNPTVYRARVAYWHLVERLRGRQEEAIGNGEHPVKLWSRTPDASAEK